MFFSLIWRDSEFVLSHIDLIKNLLSEKHLFSDKNYGEVRIGLANSNFVSTISDDIVEWYSHEDSTSTLYYLRKYITLYQDRFADFKEIVEYQKNNGDCNIKSLITLDSQLYRDVPFWLLPENYQDLKIKNFESNIGGELYNGKSTFFVINR